MKDIGRTINDKEKEEQFFNEFYTRKKMVRICRTYELYESFISAIIDSPNTKLLAQIYFFPDIPESLDLKTLKYDMGKMYLNGFFFYSFYYFRPRS